MSELEDLLGNITSQFSNKINEIYEKKMEEHKLNISTNLSEDYTENYGMFDLEMPIPENVGQPKYETLTRIDGTPYTKKYIVSDIYLYLRDDKQIILEINNFIKAINKDRYIIHCFKNTKHFSKDTHNNLKFYYNLIIFDNYGDFCIITTNVEQKTIVTTLKDPNVKVNLCFTSKYKLPNILIDFIKNEFVETFIYKEYELHYDKRFCGGISTEYFKTNNQYVTSGNYKSYSGIEKQMRPLNILSEEYYKRFTKDKKIEELIESNEKYIKEIEQLKEEISEKDLLISSFQNNKGNKETKSDLFAFSDILFQQIKDLQEQIEEYKKQIFQFEKEKEETSKKYNEMQTKIKKLLDIE